MKPIPRPQLRAPSPDDGRPGDLWSGQGRAWRRWMRSRRPHGRGPLVLLAILAVLAAAVVTPVLIEDAPETCTALERRIGRLLSAPATLRHFGENGRHGRAAARRRVPWMPPVVVCAGGWWQVVAAPGAAGRWFAAMR